MTGLSWERVMDKVRARGVSEEVLSTLRHAGIDFKQWLSGFEKVEDGVRASVSVIRNHPLLPRDVAVHGMLMDSETGALKVIVEGYVDAGRPQSAADGDRRRIENPANS